MTLFRDAAQATRGLRRAPGFTLVVVITLALGIGGTTAVYTVMRAVLLEPLPYPRAEELVRLYQFDRQSPAGELHLTAPHLLYVREHASSFASVGILYTYDETSGDLMVADEAERVPLLRVSADYFDALGVTPAAGRVFERAEEDGRALAILSDRLRRRMGGEVGLGSTIELDGRTVTVIGVMPASLVDPLVGQVDVWMPEDLASPRSPGNHFLSAVARLAPGVSVARARAELALHTDALAALYPDAAAREGIRLVPLHDDLVAGARPVLLLLMGSAALVFLIALVNVANLQMVRALGRAREFAVLSAIGAARGRIGRRLLTESLVLSLAGGVAGVAVATLGVAGLLLIGGDAVPAGVSVDLDGSALTFALVMSVAAGLLFGVVPGVHAAGTDPASILRAAGRSSPASYVPVRSVLVSAQVALAMILLTGAATLGVSLHRLRNVELGIDPGSLLTFELHLPPARYDAPARAAFHRAMVERLEGIPGVRSAAAISWLPVTGMAHTVGWEVTLGPAGGAPVLVAADRRAVEGRYFETMGIPLLAGRTFDERDDTGTPRVVVISRDLADKVFPGESAMGRTIAPGGSRESIVIGVVGDVAATPEGQGIPHVYFSHRQYAERLWAMHYVVSTTVRPTSVLEAVRREVAGMDPRLVVHEPVELAEVVGRGRSDRRFASVLTGTFAALALALAVLGLYGLLSYTVHQRRREIGIRLALGAPPARVVRQIAREGLVVTLIGIAVGTAGALGLTGVVASLVFETAPGDARFLAGAAGVLVLAAALAAVGPSLNVLRFEIREVMTGE